MKIYILDKDSNNSNNLLKWLTEIKPVESVELFTNHEAILQKAKKAPPDFCMIRLGDSNNPGLKTADMLKKINDNIKIIFMADNRDYVVSAYEIGAYGYILEPINKVKLQNYFTK